MASDTNKVILIGRLTRDPEMRQLPGGTAVAEFSIAVNSTQKNKQSGEWEDYANFFSVTVFGRGAESVARFCGKGSRVAVAGRLEQRRWETDNGSKRERVGIVADNVQFLETKSEREQRGSQAPAPASEDVPF